MEHRPVICETESFMSNQSKDEIGAQNKTYDLFALRKILSGIGKSFKIIC